MKTFPVKSKLTAILIAGLALIWLSGCESPKGLVPGKVVDTPQGCSDQRVRDSKGEC